MTARRLPRHYVDHCVTAVALGNQKFVYAAMSGTLNGEPVHSCTSNNAAAIFNNNFTYITVPHGGCQVRRSYVPDKRLAQESSRAGLSGSVTILGR
jgi:hypothetical protein